MIHASTRERNHQGARGRGGRGSGRGIARRADRQKGGPAGACGRGRRRRGHARNEQGRGARALDHPGPAGSTERIHLQELLPREASQPARRPAAPALSRLRLTMVGASAQAGWRAGPGPRVAAAVLAGAALSLAFPGPNFGPVAFVALVPLLPLARVIGAYGLSAVIVAVNLALAAWLRSLAPRARARSWPARRELLPVIGWPALAVALVLVGLLAPAAPAASGRPLNVVVVQAGLAGGHGLDRGATTEAVFGNFVRRTQALVGAGGPRPDLVVWGEDSVDDDPLVNPDRMERIRQVAASVGAPLLVGATTDAGDGHYATEALLFTPGGQLADRYRKRRLVPFGEYVPMASLMGRILPVTREGVPFDKIPGRRLEPMTVDGTRVGAIICWESTYPEDSRTLVREGAQVLLVSTNNASFGEGPASLQHLAASQLRAVEEGRTVVQAAVSGVSAVISPDGVASRRTGLYQQATLRIPVTPRDGLTLYARAGRLIEAAMIAIAVATALVTLLPWMRRRPAPAAPPPTQSSPEHAAIRGSQ